MNKCTWLEIDVAKDTFHAALAGAEALARDCPLRPFSLLKQAKQAFRDSLAVLT